MMRLRMGLLLLAFCAASAGRCGENTVADPQTQITVAELVRQIRPALATIRTEGRDGNERGIGTGFVVSAEGLIATNLHVIGQGRPFSVEMADGRKLKPLAVEASDHTLDLAIVRVEVDPDNPLEVLQLKAEKTQQGTPAVVMGNPWGLKDSVVTGVISAFREIEGQELLQMAMPIEPGNSGGPVVNMAGQVIGVVNMKSAHQQNVGFAIQTDALLSVLEKPNPVKIDRWTTIGALDARSWTPLFGADWRQRGGKILVSGTGQGFGGRSLCLWDQTELRIPFEVAVSVKLNDEAGAAGLIFHADGKHKHYGFYPSNGNLRLSCFRGPTVYSWQVLDEKTSRHYNAGQWNRLKVRVETDRFLCYVNQQLVFESRDTSFVEGKVGLSKFRQTQAEFKNFRVGEDLAEESATPDELVKLREIVDQLPAMAELSPEDLQPLQDAAPSSAHVLAERARAIEREAERLARTASDLRRLADDLHVHQVAQQIAELASQDPVPLLHCGLLIAALEDRDLHIESYLEQVKRMADEIRNSWSDDADAEQQLAALNRYLFDENGYHGSRFEYYHRANSFLNRVIDEREGLPISLSVLYLELARQLDLSMEGVGLPGHFVVRYLPSEGEPYLIDVFERGRRLGDEDVRRIVREFAGEEDTTPWLIPAAPTEIVSRMLRNLLGVVEREGDKEAMLRYLEALVVLNPESVQMRGLRGVVRSETGRRTAAIADLDWILERQPAEIDLDQIRQMREFFEQRDE